MSAAVEVARGGHDVLMTLSIDVTSDDTRPGLMSVAVARESWFELAGFDVMMMPPLVIDELGAEMALAGSMRWTLTSYWYGRNALDPQSGEHWDEYGFDADVPGDLEANVTLVEATVGMPETERTGDSVWFDVGATEYWSLSTFEGGSDVYGYYSRVPS